MANEPGTPAAPPAKSGAPAKPATEPKAAPPAAGGPSPKFRSFLVGLATDPARLGRFIKDPDAVLGESGLPPEDQDALRSGNANAIYARLLPAPAEAAAPQQPVLVVVVDVTQGGPGAEAVSVRTGAAGLPAGGAIMFPQIPQITMPQITFPQITFPQVFPQIILAQGTPGAAGQVSPFLQFPQILPPLQIAPPQITFPQIFPQIILAQTPQGGAAQLSPLVQFPQITPLQITPLQVFPQITPLQIVQPQIHPQIVQPQIHPQIVQPQIHPQIVQPQIHPQIVQPQITFPQITPLQIVQPQIAPQIVQPVIASQVFPQIFPQIYPQIFAPGQG